MGSCNLYNSCVHVAQCTCHSVFFLGSCTVPPTFPLRCIQYADMADNSYDLTTIAMLAAADGCVVHLVRLWSVRKKTTTVPYLYVFIRNACSGYIQGDECCADWLNEMSHKKTITRHRCKIYSASEIQVFTAGQINGRHLSLLPSSSTHSLHRKQTHTRTHARTRTHTPRGFKWMLMSK